VDDIVRLFDSLILTPQGLCGYSSINHSKRQISSQSVGLDPSLMSPDLVHNGDHRRYDRAGDKPWNVRFSGTSGIVVAVSSDCWHQKLSHSEGSQNGNVDVENNKEL